MEYNNNTYTKEIYNIQEKTEQKSTLQNVERQQMEINVRERYIILIKANPEDKN